MIIKEANEILKTIEVNNNLNTQEMKTIGTTKVILILAFLSFTILSCKDGKKEAKEKMNTEMKHDNGDEHHDTDKKEMVMTGNEDGSSEMILENYFNLKNALVSDDNDKTKELGATLAKNISSFDVSEFTDAQKLELDDIFKDAKEHATHISESDMKHQREHFKVLSKDITDMIAMTGSENKLYEQFCPMYDGGAAWLSMNEEIRNPYYGSKMLKCGKVQREIN